MTDRAVSDPTKLRKRIADNLRAFPVQEIALESHRPAAVALVVRAAADRRASLIITRRTSKLARHRGQFALPGGRVDAGESALEAAIRETDEEIGLRLSPGDLLGRLDDYATRSGFVMMPWVFWSSHAAPLEPNPHEVEHVFDVPLAELDREDAPRLVEIPESDRPVIQMPILDNLINAPTAAILYQLREVALHGRATRVAHYEQPVWAWR